MIRVLVVDDSAVVRRILSEELGKFPDIEVIGTAIDPFSAREKIAKLKPDVITLDIEMPRMDGLSFLEKLMQHFPIPTVIVSSLARRDSENYLRALELGAIEIVDKPNSQFTTPDVKNGLIQAIRTASRAKVFPNVKKAGISKPKIITKNLDTTHKIIAIGASTGGTQAIEKVLREFPPNAPGTVIVQHMPETFTYSFANRLNSLCAVEVREAKDGDVVVPGVVLVAPGNRHLLLQREGARYCVSLKNGAAVNFHRPSVDVMFQSVARNAGKNATGVLLTGMGSDGANGLLTMRQNGAKTIAQDEATSVVFGMPGEAVKIGAANEILPLPEIANSILSN